MIDHRGNVQPQIDQEEHTHIQGVGLKKVAVIDNAGNQITSFGSSTVAVSSLVTLGASPNYIGLVSIAQPISSLSTVIFGGAGATIFAVVNTSAAGSAPQQSLTTLLSGPNQIGSVTVSNPLTLLSPITLAPSPNFIGLTTIQGQVEGNIGSGGADSGNPVKAGGKFNSTLPTFSDGQRGDLQIESRGALRIALYNGANAIAALVDNADDAAVSGTANRVAVVNRNTVFDGSTWDRMRGDSTNGVLVNLGANNDVSVIGNITLADPKGFIGMVSTASIRGEIVELSPSSRSGRTHVDRMIDSVTANATIYPVSAGKTFYLTDLLITARNTDVTAMGRGAISDLTTDKIPFGIGVAVAGAVAPSLDLSKELIEPVSFATVVNYTENAGALTTSVFISGYEE